MSLAFCHAAGAQKPHAYNPAGKRDPFVPLVGVISRSAGSLEEIMVIEDVDIQGVATDSTGNTVAIINGEMITEGETAGRLTIKKISKNDITLTIDDTEYRLSLTEDAAR